MEGNCRTDIMVLYALLCLEGKVILDGSGRLAECAAQKKVGITIGGVKRTALNLCTVII